MLPIGLGQQVSATIPALLVEMGLSTFFEQPGLVPSFTSHETEFTGVNHCTWFRFQIFLYNMRVPVYALSKHYLLSNFVNFLLMLHGKNYIFGFFSFLCQICHVFIYH
jgi:hypothetical protein